MSSFPTINAPEINATPNSIGARDAMLGYVVGTSSGIAWPAANRALFYPIRIAAPCQFDYGIVATGTGASSNWMAGIYNASGNKLWASAAIAKTASATQATASSGLTVGPGLYYIAFVSDGTQAFVGRSAASVTIARMGGMLEMASAYPLPATATFAACTSQFVVDFHMMFFARPS